MQEHVRLNEMTNQFANNHKQTKTRVCLPVEICVDVKRGAGCAACAATAKHRIGRRAIVTLSLSKRKIKHKNFKEEQNDFDNDHESRRIDTAVGAVLSARADDRLRRTQHHITRHIRCSACTFSNSKSNTEQTITNDSNRSWERQAVADQTAQLRRSSMASTAIRSSRTLRLFWSTSVFMIFVEYYLVIDY